MKRRSRGYIFSKFVVVVIIIIIIIIKCSEVKIFGKMCVCVCVCDHWFTVTDLYVGSV